MSRATPSGRTKTPRVDRDRWRTPPEVVADLARRFDVTFGLDAAATTGTEVCARGISPEMNALAMRWAPLCPPDGAVWLNPPYSQRGGGLLAWSEKAAEAAAERTVVVLAPSTPDARWFRLLWKWSSRVLFSEGRIQFLQPDGSPSRGNPGGSSVFLLHRNSPGAPRVEFWPIPRVRR
jgi:phage N-6-adenine-methyltransferase